MLSSFFRLSVVVEKKLFFVCVMRYLICFLARWINQQRKLMKENKKCFEHNNLINFSRALGIQGK